MTDLIIFDLYNKTNNTKIKNFSNKINSTLHLVTDYNKVECNFEWLDIMEETIRYLDNILRNPNRFIVNEEDVIKIELARRITVESIKHLSRNTNLIQEFDKDTGDIKPSKILNINKEESFDTYENRFIYSLIQNMKFYIDRKKRNMVSTSSLKHNKQIDYKANCEVGNENIDLSLILSSKINKNNSNEESALPQILERIEKLELQITDLTTSAVYQDLQRKHVALVTSPIKKTNVILKNVNFQYALRLWNYLQENIDNDVKTTHEKKDYFDTGTLKKYMDESFLIDYLVIDSLNNQEEQSDHKELSEKIVSQMVNKIMDLSNGNINEEELKNLVAKEYNIIKYKTVVNDREIYKIFKSNMDKYLEFIQNIKF